MCVSEIDRKLRAVNSLLSPEPQDRRTRRRVSHPPPADDDIIITGSNDDDVIIMSPSGGVEDSPYSSSVREFPLKVRCRTDVHKISVLSVRHSPLVIPLPQRPRCDVICLIGVFSVDAPERCGGPAVCHPGCALPSPPADAGGGGASDRLYCRRARPWHRRHHR